MFDGKDKYAVALSRNEGRNKIYVVEADGGAEAMVTAVKTYFGDSVADQKELIGILERAKLHDMPANLILYGFNVSNPLNISKMLGE